MLYKRYTPTLPPRFWEKVNAPDYDSCWEWTAGKSHNGYGVFAVNSRPRRAHRLMWEAVHGPIAADVTQPWGTLLVMHTCDNPGCVNPAHLSLGTQRQNLADSAAKGRYTEERRARMRNAQVVSAKNRGERLVCKHGHSLLDAYVQRKKSGSYKRACRTCVTLRKRAWYAKQRQKINDH